MPSDDYKKFIDFMSNIPAGKFDSGAEISDEIEHELSIVWPLLDVPMNAGRRAACWPTARLRDSPGRRRSVPSRRDRFW